MRHIYVEPGNLAALKDRGVLESFLGSCVGVALYDAKAEVAGMIHVLLPEGSERAERANPATYASSGIPLLARKMEEMGARPERLVAHLAGGAAILGRVPGVDLNIGRRNVMVARQVLEFEGIPVVTESIGGSFGRGIRIQVPGGKVDVRMSLACGESEGAGGGVLVRDLRHLIEEAAEGLQPDSKIAIMALQLVGCEKVDFKELEALILKDQILAASILKIANSARYGLPRRISRISQAISLLGLNTFKKIVMQACVKDLFSAPLGGYGMEEGDFFRHAVACAEIAGRIGSMVEGLEDEEAYLGGLLHDIGKIALERSLPEFFSIVRRRVIQNREPFVGAEKKVFGQDHAEVGGMVAFRWNLPEVLEEAVAFHHDPSLASTGKKLVSAVHVANFVCNMVGIGLCCDTMANRVSGDAIEALQLSTAQVMELIGYVPRVLYKHGN